MLTMLSATSALPTGYTRQAKRMESHAFNGTRTNHRGGDLLCGDSSPLCTDTHPTQWIERSPYVGGRV